MKKLFNSGYIVLIVISLSLTDCSSLAPGVSSERVSSATASSDATWSQKEVAKWYKKGEWLNGMTKLKPHPTINQQEFSRQYHTPNGKIYWDKAFAWLNTNDLENIKPGNYPIDPGNVSATVSLVATKDPDEVNFETHRMTNDLQLVIKYKALMGIVPVTDTINNKNAKMKSPYGRGDTEAFDVVKKVYYTAEPGTFFIFSPKEIHRPAVKAPGFDTVKKILIKVKVP